MASSSSAKEADKPKKNVAYFYSNEIYQFDVSSKSPVRPFRGHLTHELLELFDLYKDHLQPIHPRLVSITDIAQYHADAYVNALQLIDIYMNPFKKFSEEESKEIEKLMNQFNISKEKTAVNCVFPGLLDYIRLYTSGSMGCADALNHKRADIAINWFGGMHHARISGCYMGCFVNDCVLAILELLKSHRRVLYVDLDATHCDAVEEAFYTTYRVMTISFHMKPRSNLFPACSGSVDDTGAAAGEGFAVNVPFDAYVNDDTFVHVFRSVLNKAVRLYIPEVIVLQCGATSLAGDRVANFNLSSAAHGECVRIVRDFDLPLLVLGGAGTNMSNAARLWAYETAILTHQDESLPESIPSHTYYAYYAPDFKMKVDAIENIHQREDGSEDEKYTPLKAVEVLRTVLGNIDGIIAPPKVTQPKKRGRGRGRGRGRRASS